MGVEAWEWGAHISGVATGCPHPHPILQAAAEVLVHLHTRGDPPAPGTREHRACYGLGHVRASSASVSSKVTVGGKFPGTEGPLAHSTATEQLGRPRGAGCLMPPAWFPGMSGQEKGWHLRGPLLGRRSSRQIPSFRDSFVGILTPYFSCKPHGQH